MNIVADMLAKCEEAARDLGAMANQIMTPTSPSKRKLNQQAFAVAWLVEQYRTIEEANVELEKTVARLEAKE